MTSDELGGIVWRTSSYTYGNGNCVEVGWRTSSYSRNGSACVEVGWRKSSHSANENCLEVAWPAVSGVAVRDSKHRAGPALTFPTPDWCTFLSRLA